MTQPPQQPGVPSDFWKHETNHEDSGHIGLCNDMRDLMAEVHQYNFHDYKNKKYAVPKMALVEKLGMLISRAQQGWYDNKNAI